MSASMALTAAHSSGGPHPQECQPVRCIQHLQEAAQRPAKRSDCPSPQLHEGVRFVQPVTNLGTASG